MYPIAIVTLSLYPSTGKDLNIFYIIDQRENRKAARKVYGQLVPLGFDITVFTPVAYQRDSLSRPLKEI